MIKKILYYAMFILLGSVTGFFISKFLHDEFFIDIKICFSVFALIFIIFVVSAYFILSKDGNESEEDFSVSPTPEEFSRKSDVWGWLTPQEGPLKSGYALIKDRILMGRDVKCDILVNHESVSREHAEIVRTENGYYIRDIGSKNGIYVNNQRLKEAELSDGDSIILGNKHFSIKITQEIRQPLLPETYFEEFGDETAVYRTEEEKEDEDSNE